MTIQEMELQRLNGPLPQQAAHLLADAQVRTDCFQYLHRDNPVSAFVGSDYYQVYLALVFLQQSGLLRGRCFCEWGSGLGVVAGLASILNFLSHGIEVEPALVIESRQLLDRHQLDVTIAEGSFIAGHITAPPLHHEDIAWVDLVAEPAYDALDLEPADIDLFFVYPWPGEDHFILELFDQMASTNAMLLIYRGIDELACWKKIGD